MSLSSRPADRSSAPPGLGAAVEPVTAAERLAEQFRVIRRVAATRGRALGIDDATLPQLRLLLLLESRRESTGTEIAEILGLSRAAVSALVERLVRRGWVTRTEAECDRRQRVLAVTPAGREVVDEADGLTTRFYAGLIAQLSEVDRAELARIVGLLAAAAEREASAGEGARRKDHRG